MREQVTHGHGRVGRAQLRRRGRSTRIHADVGKRGNVFADRIVQADFALIYQLEHTGRDHWLGHGVDAEDVVALEPLVIGDVAPADHFFVADAAAPRDHGDDAGQLAGIDILLQHRLNARESGFRESESRGCCARQRGAFGCACQQE